MKCKLLLAKTLFCALVVTYANGQSHVSHLEKVTKIIVEKLDSLAVLLNCNYKILKENTDSQELQKIKKQTRKLELIADKWDLRLLQEEFRFVKNNPSSFVSLDLLEKRLQKNNGGKYHDKILLLFQNLSKKIKYSNKGKEFIRLKESQIGSVAYIFACKDINNKIISLSSFRNKKYILLDFWASWCGPCKEDIPFLKEIYKKYKYKGLEIISISKDYNESSWKKIIEQDSLQIWIQILAPQLKTEMDSSIFKDYFIQGIPVKILIDKNGVIIGKWQGGGVENRLLLDQKLLAIFNCNTLVNKSLKKR